GFYVAGCPSEGRFTDDGDGTVMDTCTGLMWQKETADVDGDGQISHGDVISWCDALAYCKDLNFAGHDDWRLPNVRELQSIVDYGSIIPAIDPVFSANDPVIGSLQSYPYWTSTSLSDNHDNPHVDDYAWHIDFLFGRISDEDLKINHEAVRAVRNAQ